MRHRLRARPVHHRRRERAPVAPTTMETIDLRRPDPVANEVGDVSLIVSIAPMPIFRHDDPDAFVVDWAPPTS